MGIANWNFFLLRNGEGFKCNHEQKGPSRKLPLCNPCPVRSDTEFRKAPYFSLLGILLWRHMSISSTGENDATRWKPLLLVPVYSTDHPQGSSFYYLPHPPTPRPLIPVVLISYITHLFHSHNQIKSPCMEHCVHFDCVVHLCNEIKPSPFLPDLIRTTWRFIWKSVSS